MDTVRNTVAQNLGGLGHVVGTSQFSLSEVPDLSGKVGLVTGGTEGIGFGSVHTLLSHGISKLFVTSLHAETGEAALNQVEEDLGTDVRKRVVYIQCDQSDWVQAAELTQKIASQTDRLDILIANAARGIMTVQRAPSNDVDLHFATNVAGHHVIVSHLLPLLEKTASNDNKVRIVFLSSNLHESTDKKETFSSLEDINQDFGPNGQYGRSKLMNLLQARYLDRHLHRQHPNILINAVHPGIVDTAQTNKHIHEAYPVMGYGMSVAMKPFKKSQFEGCVTSMYAATTVEDSGLYICPPATVEAGSDMSRDEQLAENLMKTMREIIEMKTRSESSAQGCPFKDS